jgi:hypothetical protein
MKMRFAVAAVLTLIASSGAAQSVCRQAAAVAVQRQEGLTIFSVSLPLPKGTVAAKALIPNTHSPSSALVFSLSALVQSEPEQTVEMMPVAADLARHGHPVILIERRLTWPLIAPSVGKMQAEALCAEQWLATHAAVNADEWIFVGPGPDIPTLDQLHAVGDPTSMTFNWGITMAGPDEDSNTDGVLRDPALIPKVVSQLNAKP